MGTIYGDGFVADRPTSTADYVRAFLGALKDCGHDDREVQRALRDALDLPPWPRGQLLTLEEAVKHAVEQHGGIRAAERATGVDKGFISRLLRGLRTAPSHETLVKLGLRAVPFYEVADLTCTRSHPHENMDADCERLTILARRNASDHVCGMAGYNGMIDPPCPGCERRRASFSAIHEQTQAEARDILRGEK